MNLAKQIKRNSILLVPILIGAFLRAYHPLHLFQYSHDQDLAGWFIRDVLVNHHLRLVGQETSSHGIFIGPYFYYLQIPFYAITNLDPSGSLLLPLFLGISAIISVYFVLKNIFDKETGLIAALIYSVSSLIVFTDREVVPTQPVMLWSIWFLFSVWRIIKGEEYGYLTAGILAGLIWSINLQLAILMPLLIIAQLLSKKRINTKELLIAIAIALILNIPLIAFEIRHGYGQTKSLAASLITNKDYVPGTAIGFIPKLDRTMQLVYKNAKNLFLPDSPINIPPQVIFWTILSILLILLWNKKIKKSLALISILWIALFILFFSKISLNISEYYLNGMNIVYVSVVSVFINSLLKDKKLKVLGGFLLGGFIFLNLISFFTKPTNASGYIERKSVISLIKEDSEAHGYPCVSISFITSPGNNLGYRYFTWELGIKTKPISNQIPVYTIVFPLNLVNKFDKSFGAIGLILPDYKRYNGGEIKKACEGDDYTVTESMFGFTK